MNRLFGCGFDLGVADCSGVAAWTGAAGTVCLESGMITYLTDTRIARCRTAMESAGLLLLAPLPQCNANPARRGVCR